MAVRKIQIQELKDVVERCAGIDVHKKTVSVCVIRGEGSQPAEGEVRQYGTTTRELQDLSNWLKQREVRHIVMESTGVYWKPVWQILESAGFHLLLANAKAVRNMPGKKTDTADCVWLATLLRKGLIQPSFIPPAEIRALRDLCRGRTTLVRERTRMVQRIEKLLEEGNIKLDCVISDLMGVSGRKMLEELAAGETDAEQLAELALGRMRPKIPQLVLALEGHLRPHQIFLLKQWLAHFDELSSRIEKFEQEIEVYVLPFEPVLGALDAAPGVDRLSGATILSEIGVDMRAFPTAAQFCSWATLCPGNQESGGKRGSGRTRKGNRWLRGIMTQSAWAATHVKDSYYRAQYKRLAPRIGKQRALVAVAHSMLTAIWFMLAHNREYAELGADFFDRQNVEGQKRAAVKRLQRLGFTVTLQRAA